MSNKWWWLVMGCCIFWGYAVAAAPPVSLYNPKPASGDIILPMPECTAFGEFGAAEMVFRAARVPGAGFWGDEQRIVQIGDASGGIFEGLQRIQISGSFPTTDGSGWVIYLAKYELTVGQYVALMGLESLLQVSGDSNMASLTQYTGRQLREQLLRPLTFVGYHDIQNFIREYNRWLFDPAHPERMASLPRIENVPGFLRLPTEEEWEYVARGGLPALQAGTFNDRAPFPAGQAQRHAWFADNAREGTRPIGLRPARPTSLGFYDLFGNAQEMTSGLFRPEIWQGKPGGVAVRGGSVQSTSADLRSAQRQEFDTYAWDTEHQRMVERRNFITGARLAIGANVVVTEHYRQQLVQEYTQYRNELRRSMPVGQTLDNLVTQATIELDTIDPILEHLKAENHELQEQLDTVQAYMDNARQRLEQAQRQSARSLAQDAARNGTILGFHLSRLHSLARARTSAAELAEISTRYQNQLRAVDQRIQDEQAAADEQFRGYSMKIAQLGDYEFSHIKHALTLLDEGELPMRERVVLELLGAHLEEFVEQRRVDSERWFTEFRERFARFEDG